LTNRKKELIDQSKHLQYQMVLDM